MVRATNTPVWLVIIVGLLVAAAAYRIACDLVGRERQSAFEQTARDRVFAIERGIVESLEIVRSSGDFISAIGEVNEENFRGFVGPAIRRNPSIQAIEWVPRVPGDQRAQHERMAAADGHSGYRISERGENGGLRRASVRPVYYPVRYVEPRVGNEPAIGFDVGADPTRRHALDRARDTGTLIASGPIGLVQEARGDQFAFLTFYAVYEGKMPPPSVEERRRRLRGFALGVFRVDHVITAPFTAAAGPNLELDVNVVDAESNTVIFSRRFGARAGNIAPPDPGIATAGPEYSRSVDLGERVWRVTARPAKTTGPGWEPWAVAMLLLVITGLLAAYVNTSRRQVQRTRELVEQRTAALNQMVRNLTRLHAISTDVSRPFSERAMDALDLGREIFGMPLALVSRVEDGRYTVEHMRGPEGAPEPGSEFPVGDTYCERTLAADSPIGFHSAAGTEWEKHPCYSQFNLKAYIGAPIVINGEAYGTLNFSSPEPRPAPFSEEEVAFVRLLAEWAGNEIERSRNADALTESYALYQGLLRDSLQGTVIDRDSVPLYVNRAFVDIFGYDDESEVLRLPNLDPLYAPEERARIQHYRHQRIRGNHAQVPSRYEFRGLRKDGQEIWCEHLSQPITWMGQIAIRTFTQDITARKRANEEVERLLELRTDEVKLRDRAILAANNGITITDAKAYDNPIVFVNPAFERITGYPAEELVGQNCRILQKNHRNQPEVEKIRNAVDAGRAVHVVLKNYRKDGRPFWNALEIAPVRDAAGDLTHFIGIQTDVTEARHQEEQIRGLQRLESVGRLTGGIAHDFNNLLTVIVGNLRLASAAVGDNDEAKKRIDGASEAAFRGSGLIRQLLAFSRQQILEPDVVDPTEIVANTCSLLTRTLGKSIVIETRFDSGVQKVRVDTAQLETALINLAINSRDAMATGGRLTVGVSNVELGDAFSAQNPGARPGDHVCISVEDTGSGMSEAVEKQAVEPFFTTKDVGEGSGLGLSMVYGFVKQSDGYLDIRSNEGIGTRIRLFLPVSRTEEKPGDSETEPGPLPTGNESVLVVEDEADVREITVALLEMLGYRVTQAADADAALRMIEDGIDMDLLFTDVVMPGSMNGLDLAQAVKRLRPEVSVLITSGHAAEAFQLKDADQTGFELLRKPYADDELARRTRAILDGNTGTTG